MYLKRLEIQGFKSFADKVDFEFSPGITAIVGPNGSGKSNVVDSIRWVLGEQSAKSLRGSKMDDVIFAGSVDRRAVGMAQVSLTLDNSGGLFPLDYNEVTVTRRLYRSGESEYLINKTSCRLKDIHELFMDTGLGREGFSIISQGKVDEILSLKPEDRRGLIEEAAGIIKYKHRKREAERKLEDTEENMLRLNDIIAELGERVGPLGEQAEKARNYQLWKQELDALEISIEVSHLEDNQAKEKQLSAELSQTEDQLAQQMAGYAQLAAQLEQDKLAAQQMEQDVSAAQEAYYELQSQVEKCESDITLTIQLRSSFSEQDKKLQEEAAYFRQEAQKIDQQLQDKEQEHAALSDQLLAHRRENQQLGEQIAQLDQTLKATADALQAAQSETIEAMREQARNNNERSRLRQELQNNDSRLKRISEKVQRLNAEKAQLAQELSALEAALAQLMAEHEQAQQQKQEKNRLQQAYLDKREQARRALEETNGLYQQAHSRLQALKELEESGEGYQFGVKSVLEQKKAGRLSGIIGTVAQLIQVPDHLERAIETVMGAAVQNIVVESDSAAQQAIQYLKQHQKGRATFLPLNTVKGKKAAERLEEPSVLGLAVDLITFEPQYTGVMNHLLGKVWVVKDMASAVAIGKKHGFNYRLVTLDGELLTPGGALTGGNYAKQKGGLLSRQRQITELEGKTQLFYEQQKQHQAQLEQMTLQYQALTTEIETLRADEQAQQLKQQEVQQKREQLLKEKHRLSNEITIEEMDEQQLVSDKASLEQALQKEELLAQQIIGGQEALAEQIANLKAQSAQADGQLSDLQQKYQQSQIQLATSEQRQHIFLEQAQQLKDQRQEFLRQAKQKETDLEALMARFANKDQELEEYRRLLQQLTVKQQAQGQALQQQKEQRQNLQETLTAAEEKAKVLQQQLDHVKEQRYQLDVALNKVRLQIENALQHLSQSFECTYEEALLCKIDIDNEKEAQKRISKLKAAVQNLGPINFNAIEEHQQVQERLVFLTEQMEDLEQAKQSLNKVIKEMEQIMAQKFKETYQVVNDTFSEVFRTMFAGGQARLELSTPNDYLLTGIEIVAQPPGKKEQILSLLSGGERAMTAIALLFALLTVKPSPFCILDEIEAALDEVNVERFARFIKEYTNKTQFIVISHRKGTMEAADTLYGVAMENNGVSRLMSVKLTDYQ